MLSNGYLEIYKSPLDFEITRVDCIFLSASTERKQKVQLERIWYILSYLTRNVRECAPEKIQINLHICAAWLEYSLGTLRIAKDAKYFHAGNNDWANCVDSQADSVFVRRTGQKYVFSRCDQIIGLPFKVMLTCK